MATRCSRKGGRLLSPAGSPRVTTRLGLASQVIRLDRFAAGAGSEFVLLEGGPVAGFLTPVAVLLVQRIRALRRGRRTGP